MPPWHALGIYGKWGWHAGEVIADGQDCTSRHPLRHALMVAIDAAAARDRRLWPIKSKDASTAGMSQFGCPQADTAAVGPDNGTAGSDASSAQGDVCVSRV